MVEGGASDGEGGEFDDMAQVDDDCASQARSH